MKMKGFRNLRITKKLNLVLISIAALTVVNYLIVQYFDNHQKADSDIINGDSGDVDHLIPVHVDQSFSC